MKPLRAFSFVLAVVFNTVYWASLAEFWFLGNRMENGKSTPNLLDLMFFLFGAFNMILNMPTMFINVVIIANELKIEYKGKNRFKWDENVPIDSMKLGISDMMYALEYAFNLLNPIWWFNRISGDVNDEKDELQAYLDSLSEEEL